MPSEPQSNEQTEESLIETIIGYLLNLFFLSNEETYSNDMQMSDSSNLDDTSVASKDEMFEKTKDITVYFICGFLTIFGAILIVYGRRIQQMCLPVIGFIVGFIVSYLIFVRYVPLDWYVCAGLAILPGTFCSAVSTVLFAVGMTLAGFLGGYNLGAIILALGGSMIINNDAGKLILVITFGVICAFVAFMFRKNAFIAISSFCGSFFVVGSIDKFAGGSLGDILFFLISENDSNTITWVPYFETTMIFVATAFGILFQTFITAKKEIFKKKPQDSYQKIYDSDEDILVY